jgi:ferric-dicitrate binding protein FerR (iron transport regulator)
MNRLEELLARWRADELTADELPELTRLLRDPAAQSAARASFEFDALLHETVRGQALYERVAAEFDARYPREQPVALPTTAWEEWRGRLAWAAALALAALIAFSASRWKKSAPVAALLQVEEVHGAVTWSATDGRTRTDLRSGNVLEAGSLETLDADSTLRVRFADGTACTLGGAGGLVSIASGAQKVVRLKTGTLAVQAARQPAGQPMRILTPTAEVEVVGTAFAVATHEGRTSLDVDEGRVRMRRLADGREVEVPAAQVALATLDRAASFEPRPRPPAVRDWQTTFATAPTPDWTGTWRPGALQAQPYVAGRPPRFPSLITRFGVRTDFTAALEQPCIVITAESVLTVRWRSAQRVDRLVLIGTEHPDGRFGGNYQMKLSAASLAANTWQETRLPLGQFAPVHHHDLATATLHLRLLVFSTAFAADGLEIAEVQITDAGPR